MDNVQPDKHSKKVTINILLIILGLALIGLFIWWQAFSKQQIADNNTDNAVSSTVSTTAPTSTATVFTAATLKAYNGLNGQPAYAAVDGLVYDMSALFRNGGHHGYKAGLDLSAAFHGQHPDSYLQGYPVVGTYQAN